MGAWDDKARAFASLHRRGQPLILFNAWDAGSAKVIAEAGAKAIATGSWSVAAAHGFADGETLPLDLALANLKRIAAAVEMPVTLDFEGAYAAEPDAVGANAAQAKAAGAVGCNFEDRVVRGEGLHPVERQSQRIAAMREAAGPGFFINARTDVFLGSPPGEHEGRFEEALKRARAYAEAGASGLFVPGLVTEALIARICVESPLPVNIMVWPGTPPLRRLAELGAARISHAAAPWRIAMRALAQAAAAAHRGEG
ncbi:MAG TPA: isocitrate lyase/phosphoenolpyruvate mutase family protein [Allosphingosinicella sp.]|nr:isocitrate lyase/phosphoenolpyruvate mutase family protein [Allosphingosinicella sp.]